MSVCLSVCLSCPEFQVHRSHKSSPNGYCLTQKVHALPDTADCKSVHWCKYLSTFLPDMIKASFPQKSGLFSLHLFTLDWTSAMTSFTVNGQSVYSGIKMACDGFHAKYFLQHFSQVSFPPRCLSTYITVSCMGLYLQVIQLQHSSYCKCIISCIFPFHFQLYLLTCIPWQHTQILSKFK